MDTTEILDQIEQDAIQRFIGDEIMYNAVKKYLLVYLYRDGVARTGVPHDGTTNFALAMAWGAINPQGIPRSDEELGQNVRALAQGIHAIESGFRELKDMKKLEAPKEEEINHE